MTMKGFLSAAVSLLAVILISSCIADGKDVKCKSWTGVLEDNDTVSISVVTRASDGFVAGTLVLGDKKYVVVGLKAWQSNDRLHLNVLDRGTTIGSASAHILEDGSIKGEIDIHDSMEISLPAVKAATMPDPFAHPSFEEIAPFTLFAANDDTEGFTYGNTVILSKIGDGLQFYMYRDGEDMTDGTITDYLDKQWTSSPYKDGKAIWTRDNEKFEVELFNGFMLFNSEGLESSDYESLYNFASGYYSLQDEDETFDSKWLSVNTHDPLEKYGVGEKVFANVPDEQYEDVIAFRKLISDQKIADLVIPVDLAQASKPNVDSYFRAIAKAFPYGLLGEAMKAANGQETDKPGTSWTLDMKNGYAKALVPGRYGDEGVELCYWRGAEGRDVVAIAFRFDATESGDVDKAGEAWFAAYFRYNPSSKSLGVVATSGCDWEAEYHDSPDHDMVWYDLSFLIRGISLPHEGKRIDLFDDGGYVIYSCEWDPEIQWFKWLEKD